MEVSGLGIEFTVYGGAGVMLDLGIEPILWQQPKLLQLEDS